MIAKCTAPIFGPRKELNFMHFYRERAGSALHLEKYGEITGIFLQLNLKSIVRK